MIGLRLFPLKSADVRAAGTRDEPLRTSVLEARNLWNEADACVAIPFRVKAMPCYEIIIDENRL